LVRISAGKLVIISKGFRIFPQSLEENVEVESQGPIVCLKIISNNYASMFVSFGAIPRVYLSASGSGTSFHVRIALRNYVHKARYCVFVSRQV
jgi:hypothetical protein